MPDHTPPQIDLARQLRAHLDSLAAAGVRFVPRGEPLALAPHRVAANQEPVAAPEPPTDPLEGRRRELKVLAAEVEKCDRCPELFSSRTNTVFGVGPIDPEVAFVGEAPGGDEDRVGEPFVGKAGQLLTRIINACGFKREEVYIFNMVKCRPPGEAGSGSANRKPSPEECANCRPFFDRQFDLVKPKHLVALGNVPAQALLNTTTGITRLRGRMYEYRGTPLLCTFHPSYLLRDETGERKRDVWEDMKLLLRTMDRPIPPAKRD
jgi:uracil-DNA glycosylase family 4